MFTYRLIMFKMSEITDFNHFPTHFEHPPYNLVSFQLPSRVGKAKLACSRTALSMFLEVPVTQHVGAIYQRRHRIEIIWKVQTSFTAYLHPNVLL